jgi:uncharacterized spore protein YtfJ
MTDDNDTSLIPADTEFESTAEAFDFMELTLDKFMDTGGVGAVYGAPIENGQTTIIPCAEVFTVLGVGGGSGYGQEKGSDQSENNGSRGGGGGGGGGGRTFSRPVAVVVASPEGVRVEPVVDATKIALAALTASGFMIGMLVRMMSPKRALRSIRGEGP